MFVRLIPITWWEEVAVQNVNFTKFIFIFRTLNKSVKRTLTQNDVNFKCKLFHGKEATAENTDQAAYVHWSLVRNYTACPEMLFDKDSMTKRYINTHADLSVSTVWGSG